MVAVVVGDQRTPHPQIGFRLVLGFVEVVQRLVHLLHRAERPLDLALGAGRGVPVVGLRRQMGEDAHAEAAHHRLEHARPADRAVVHVDRDRQALERQFGLRLGGEGVE
ncbi:hypothetical protein SPHS8_04074 [Sphingobium sp. S8]|nr:hypothetical protein SPHS8_04074 [Sphingobium sp. S8]